MPKPDKILAQELLNREVLDLTAGQVTGRIIDFILTRNGMVELIGVLPTAWYEGGRGIAPAAIASVHIDRICIEDSAALADFAPDGTDTFSLTGDRLLRKQVLQHDGELLGILTDFSFSLEDGRIIDLVVLGDSDKRSKVPVLSIRTIGRDYIVIDRGQLDTDGDHPVAPPKPPVVVDRPAEYKPTEAVETKLSAAPESVPPPTVGPETDPEDDSDPTANDALFEDAAPKTDLSKFDEKKRDYLLNRKAHRDIQTESGNLIVAKGQKMDEQVVQQIIEAGMLSDVFIELTLKK
ncbi:PRC-barrel domain-containing protein [bacterium]|nr:PRC-barrel domain-containing protein [bacterium]